MKLIILGILLSLTQSSAAPAPILHLSHSTFRGAVAVIGSCGTGSPAVIGNDSTGMITTGTGSPTSCAITFARTWTTVPHCFVSNQTQIVAMQIVPTATGLTITTSAGMTSASKLDYFCTNHQ